MPIIVDAQRPLLPRYELYPCWLDRSGLPPTARIIYKAIYSRAISLSLKNHENYTNAQGNLFVIYSNDDLAKDCAVTLSTVKAAKKILKTREYISTEKIKGSNAIRIYPRYPAGAKTYISDKSTPKNRQYSSNSSFTTDDYFDAALKNHLSPEVYEAYRNSGHSKPNTDQNLS